MITLNQYVRVYQFDNHTLVYNTINGEVLLFPKGIVKDRILSKNIPTSIEKYMFGHYFLNRDLPWDKFEERFESSNCLLISLELFLACNLSCPYCYQINNDHSKAKVSKLNLDLLFEYIASVHQKQNFSILILKVLGGEPSLDWELADYFLQKIIPFCKNNNIKLDLRIDTNCTDVRYFLSIVGYDKILFTVPLCNKEQHDQYRHLKNGKGTYDNIIENVISLDKMPNSSIVLRHNTDSFNILTFDSYLEDLAKKKLNKHIIVSQFTRHPYHGDYQNALTYQQYVDWLSSEYINLLISHGFQVSIYPHLMLEGKCQQWSNYSLKLFSDGKVGACAAHFYDTGNPYLSDIMQNGIESINTYWNSTKSTRLFHDSKCKTCPSLFTCSGHYKLPCIKEFNISPCNPEKNLYLNWDIYFHTIYKQILAGNQKYLLKPSIKYMNL